LQKVQKYSRRHAWVAKVIKGGPTGVDFTNILCTAFALADPKGTKNTVKQSVIIVDGIMLLSFI